jgi:hypothetical protein
MNSERITITIKSYDQTEEVLEVRNYNYVLKPNKDTIN